MSSDEKQSIVVLGGGSWGTAVAHLLATGGHEVHLVLRNQELARHINTYHENNVYLPGIPIHPKIQAITGKNSFLSKDPAQALATATIVVLSIPCQSLRPILCELEPLLTKNCILVNTAKGIEIHTLKTVEQMIMDEMKHRIAHYAVLSGPSFAEEVIYENPTAVVLACRNEHLGKQLQNIFSTSWFRTYSSTDVTGVEIGGATKNVIAIAAGASDGLGFGMNTRVALVTRGLAETSRLGKALGGSPLTFAGLSGLGDLFLTCSGNLSRNRHVGMKLGQGEPLTKIISSMKMVAEGVKTTEAVYTLAKNLKVEMPITKAVYNILQGRISPHEAVQNLMCRQLKNERLDESISIWPDFSSLC